MKKNKRLAYWSLFLTTSVVTALCCSIQQLPSAATPTTNVANKIVTKTVTGPTRLQDDINVNLPTVDVETLTNSSLLSVINNKKLLPYIFIDLPLGAVATAVNIVKKDAVQGRVLVDLTIDRYFNNDPTQNFPEVTADKVFARVLIKGFKNAVLVTRFNSRISIENGFYIINSKSVPNYDRQLFDWYLTDPHDELKIKTLKEVLLTRYAPYLFEALPYDINPATDIDLGDVVFDPLKGEVTCTKLELSYYYNEHSQLVHGTPKNLLSSFKLKFNNLARLQTVLKSSHEFSTDGMGMIVEQSPRHFWWDLSSSPFLGDLSTTLPSEFKPNQNLLLPDQVIALFKDLPDVAQKQTHDQWYQIAKRINHDEIGTIEFSLRVKDVNNAAGDYINYFNDEYLFHFALTGFKKTPLIQWTSLIVNDGGQYVLNLTNDDPLQQLMLTQAAQDAKYLKSFLKTTFDQYLARYIVGVDNTYQLDFDVTVDASHQSLLLTNVFLVDSAHQTIAMENLTIQGFLSANLPLITPNSEISSLTTEFPSFYSDLFAQDPYYQKIEMLQKFFRDLPANDFDILNLATTADNTTGELAISFTIAPRGLLSPQWSYHHLFGGFTHASATTFKNPTSQGGTLLIKDQTFGEILQLLNNNKQQVITYLNQHLDQLLENIIDDTITTNYTTTKIIDITPVKNNEYVVFDNHQIKLGQITVASVINQTQIMSQQVLGNVSIANTHSLTPTMVMQNVDYLTDLTKMGITDISSLRNKIQEDNTNQDLINRLITVHNPVPKATIAMNVVDDASATDTLTIQFLVSQVYDPLTYYQENQKFTFTYLLNSQSKATSIPTFIPLDTTLETNKYAYEYNHEDLKKILKDGNYIHNPVTSSYNVEIRDVQYLNALGQVTTNVYVDKYLDAHGQTLDKGKEFAVTFYGAKIATPTSLVPRKINVESSTSGFISDLDAGTFNPLDYVEIINPIEGKTTVQLSKYVEVDHKVGIVAVTFRVTGIFVERANHLVFEDSSGEGEYYTFLFVTQPPLLTTIKNDVAQNGIAANGDLAALTIHDVANKKDDEKTKQIVQKFLVANKDAIFENYPSLENLGIDHIPTTKIMLFPDVTSGNLTVNFELQGAQLTDGKGSLPCTLIITNFKNVVSETLFKTDLNIALANIVGYNANSYLVDFVSDDKIVDKITAAIETNPGVFMLNPVSQFELAGRSYVKNLQITKNAKLDNEVNVQLEYLKRHGNGTIDYTSAVDFKLSGFNINPTIVLSDTVSVENSQELVNALPANVTKEQIAIFLQSQIKNLFNFYPSTFIATNQNIDPKNISDPTHTDKTVTFNITMNDCFVGGDTGEYGIKSQTFELTLVGFASASQIQTTPKTTLNINNLAALLPDLAIYQNAYLEEIFYNPDSQKQALQNFTQALNTNPWLFFDNVPTALAGNPFVKQNSLSIEKQIYDNKLSGLTITGEFFANAQLEGEPPLYKNFSFTIQGFNVKPTEFKTQGATYAANTFFGLTKNMYYYDVVGEESALQKFRDDIKNHINQDAKRFFNNLPSLFTNNVVQTVSLTKNDAQQEIQVTITYAGASPFVDGVVQGTFSNKIQGAFTMKFNPLSDLDSLVQTAIQSVIDDTIFKTENTLTSSSDITPEMIQEMSERIKNNIAQSNEMPRFLARLPNWGVTIANDVFKIENNVISVNPSKIIIGNPSEKYASFSPAKIRLVNNSYTPQQTNEIDKSLIILIILLVFIAILVIIVAILLFEFLRSRRTSTDYEN